MKGEAHSKQHGCGVEKVEQKDFGEDLFPFYFTL